MSEQPNEEDAAEIARIMALSDDELRDEILAGGGDPDEMALAADAAFDRAKSVVAENWRLRSALERARNVLGNMAMEHETGWRSIFARWPIHHEPLRSDARHLLPVIDDVLGPAPEASEEA